MPRSGDAEDPGTWQVSFRVELLGRFSLRHGDAPVALSPSEERFAALLGTREPLDRREAAVLSWPDHPSERSKGNLRTVLWKLRRDVPGLVAERGGLLSLESDSDLDDTVTWAHAVLGGDESCSPMPEHALRELLPFWSEPWLVQPREELRQLQLHAAEVFVRRLMAGGRMAEACSRALALVTADPLRESATRLLIEIHMLEGNDAEAVQRFRWYQSILREELDCAVSPRLSRLVEPLIGSAVTETPTRRG